LSRFDALNVWINVRNGTMGYDYTKACLNLYAVIKNLEDLCAYDPESMALIRDWNVSISFRVFGGPEAYVRFANGKCEVGRGTLKASTISLFFVTPGHLNKMFENKGMPIPLRGFKQLGFLSAEFPKLTRKLEYYLKPTPTLLGDRAYLDVNTRLTLTTATFAVAELAASDPIGRLVSAHLNPGQLVLKILPDGPATTLTCGHGAVRAEKGEAAHPIGCMYFKDVQTANDLFNNKLDTFTAVASGTIQLWGQLGTIDAINLLLDRVPAYLQ
jgi:hypothetical protein